MGGIRCCGSSSQTEHRSVVSLGGWCGPALILGKLGYRKVAFPFDFSRVTLDGIIHFVTNGFDHGFFPPEGPPFHPECVGPWVLFRGQHTAFAHFDLNDPEVLSTFRRKQQRWLELLRPPPPPPPNVLNRDDSIEGSSTATELTPLRSRVTFFRTVTAVDPRSELELIPVLEGSLRRQYPDLDYRIAIVVHDQGCKAMMTDASTNGGNATKDAVLFRAAAATELAPLSPRARLWILEYTEGPEKTLFDRSQDGYAAVVRAAMSDEGWPQDSGREDGNEVRGPPAIPSWSRHAVSFMPRREWNDTEAVSGIAGDELNVYRDNALYVLRRDIQDGQCRSGGGRDTAGDVSSRPADATTGELLVWPAASAVTADRFPWRSHSNLALIAGVASVGGTCRGIGSTQYLTAVGAASAGQVVAARCVYCGNGDYHRAGKPHRTDRPFSSDEDDLLLVHLYRILTGGDKVEAVEQLAHELGRGAFEVICRLQFLTNSSLKVADGMTSSSTNDLCGAADGACSGRPTQDEPRSK